MNIEEDVNYIYNYIKYYYFSIDEFNDEGYLIDISRRIKNSMFGTTFLDGKLDFCINNFVGQELRVRNSSSFKRFAEIKNHIYLLMNYYKIYHGVNIENYNAILYELTRLVSNSYNYDDVISGNCDSDIETMIQSEIESGFNSKDKNVTIPLNVFYISSNNGEPIDEKDSIGKYIYNQLLSDINKIFKFDGDLGYLSELITNEVCKQGVSTEKLLAHGCDDLINSFVRKNMYGIKHTEVFRDVCTEVSSYVMINETYMDLPNQDEKIAEEIFRLSRCLILSGYTKKDIVTNKCSDIMERHLRFDCIAVNSTICEKTEKVKQNTNKFPLRLKKSYISAKLKALICVAVTTIMTLGEEKKGEEYSIVDEYEYLDMNYTDKLWNVA